MDFLSTKIARRMRGSVVEFEGGFDTLVVSGKVDITIDAKGRVTSNDPKMPISMSQTKNILRIMSDNTGGGICFRGEGVSIRGLQMDDTSSCTIRVKSITTTGTLSIFGGNVYVDDKKIPASAPERQPIQQTFIIHGDRVIKKLHIEGQSKTVYDPTSGLLSNYLKIVQSGDAKLYVVNYSMYSQDLVVYVTGNGKIVTKKGGEWAAGFLEVHSSGAGTLKGIVVYEGADINVSGVGLVEFSALKAATIEEHTSGLGEIVLNRLPY